MKLAVLVLLACLFVPSPSQAQSPLIGIFEGNSAGAGDGQGQPGVRVLFHQSGHQWRAFNTNCKDESCLKTIAHIFPATTTWNLFRASRPLGKVIANTPPAFHYYSEIGVQAIVNPGTVARLENRPKLGEQDPLRTILATTLPTLTDPDSWHASGISPLDSTRVRQAFRKLFPHPSNCSATGQPLPKNRPWIYPDENIKISTSYASSKGWHIAQITLGGYLCDGPPDEDFLDQWFSISPTGQITHLGQLMYFVGAADFAHDGHSELLFATQGGNDSGYWLFYDNFTQHALAAVTYH